MPTLEDCNNCQDKLVQKDLPSWLGRFHHSSFSQLLQSVDCCPLWTSCEQVEHVSCDTLHSTTSGEKGTDGEADVTMDAGTRKDLFRLAAQQDIKPAPAATYLMGAEELGLCMDPATGVLPGLEPSVCPSGEPAS